MSRAEDSKGGRKGCAARLVRVLKVSEQELPGNGVVSWRLDPSWPKISLSFFRARLGPRLFEILVGSDEPRFFMSAFFRLGLVNVQV